MYDSGSGDFGPIGNFLFFVVIGLSAVAGAYGLSVWWRGDEDWRNAVLPIGETHRYRWETILELMDKGVAAIRSWWGKR